jgi:hypothetical protein
VPEPSQAGVPPTSDPATINIPHDLLADADIFESFCENEKERAHLRKKEARAGVPGLIYFERRRNSSAKFSRNVTWLGD